MTYLSKISTSKKKTHEIQLLLGKRKTSTSRCGEVLAKNGLYFPLSNGKSLSDKDTRLQLFILRLCSPVNGSLWWLEKNTN